jgi:hypothetical protein
MSLCVACGSELTDGSLLCRHHHLGAEDHWAEGNRVLCDLLHRGKEPVRLPKEQREEELLVG